MYFINFLRLPEARDPLESARRLMKQEEDEPEDFQMDVSGVADAVGRAWPDLVREADDSPDNPTVTFGLNENTFEIELFSAGALFSLPDYTEGSLGEDFWSHVGACGEAVQFHGSLTAYDEKLDRILNFPNDIAAVRMNYESEQLKAPTTGLSAGRIPASLVRNVAIFIVLGLFVEVFLYWKNIRFPFLKFLPLLFPVVFLYALFVLFRRK